MNDARTNAEPIEVFSSYQKFVVAVLAFMTGPTQRGAFNAVSASLQQLAGGISASVAGLIIVQRPTGPLEHFDWIGYIVVAVALASLVLMYFLHRQVPEVAPRKSFPARAR